MQKNVFKFALVLIIIITCSLFIYPSFATNDEVIEDNNETNQVQDEENLEDEINNESSNENEDENQSNDVSSTKEDNTISQPVTTPTASVDRQIDSYSTLSTLPEANLGLNNILNIILIAISIIIILLAIAILIRLKK